MELVFLYHSQLFSLFNILDSVFKLNWINLHFENNHDTSTTITAFRSDRFLHVKAIKKAFDKLLRKLPVAAGGPQSTALFASPCIGEPSILMIRHQ